MAGGIARAWGSESNELRDVSDGSAAGLVRLQRLMSSTSGSARVHIGLLDGPVSTGHPDLAGARIRPVDGYSGVACSQTYSGACAHGTFIAGILAARRESRAPAICPGCTVLVRPIFRETTSDARVPT